MEPQTNPTEKQTGWTPANKKAMYLIAAMLVVALVRVLYDAFVQ